MAGIVVCGGGGLQTAGTPLSLYMHLTHAPPGPLMLLELFAAGSGARAAALRGSGTVAAAAVAAQACAAIPV